ncbi:hypothetical protein FRAHR75_450013 [Frankia sp. Hr75.2]|nr:hypothetical protein FRAHR75_450013 [Frankia sp. Hr75.2]
MAGQGTDTVGLIIPATVIIDVIFKSASGVPGRTRGMGVCQPAPSIPGRSRAVRPVTGG